MEGEQLRKVKYSHEEGNFAFGEKDYVTIVVRYWYTKELEDEVYYHGIITSVEDEGFWCVLDGEKDQKEYFSFLDIEGVLTGDRIPFLDGTAERLPRDYFNER